jgi:hypothetical protein
VDLSDMIPSNRRLFFIVKEDDFLASLMMLIEYVLDVFDHDV